MFNKPYLFAFKNPPFEVGICVSCIYCESYNVIYKFDLNHILV